MARIGIDARLWNETGVGRYTRNLVTELAKIDNKNDYILFFRKPEFESVELPGKNFSKKLADIRWHTFAEQMQFPSLLKKEQLDLVHFPYFSVPVLYNGPFVVTVHDLILHHFPTGKASTLSPLLYFAKHLGYKMVVSESIKRARKIITVSEATKQEIIKHFPTSSEKVQVTYEGFDKSIVAKKTVHFDTQHPYFLYVGNAYPHKNLERLIEAFSMLKQTSVEPIRLVLVGKEDYFYKRLKEAVKQLPFASSIIFYEKVNDVDLSLLYQHAVALVMPSLMEGFGLPAIEAMANECPVICSNIPSLREICSDVAEYFDPMDSEDMYRVLQGVLYANKSYIDGKRTLGKSRIKMFSWKKMAEQTKAIYESCLSV